jgi:hypothetical protein
MKKANEIKQQQVVHAKKRDEGKKTATKPLADLPMMRMKSKPDTNLPESRKSLMKLEPMEVKNKFERSRSSAVVHRRSEVGAIPRMSKIQGFN